MWVVVQARICHTYCLKCYGDSFTSCWQCDYVNDLAKLSGNTCNITCAIGYGNDSSVLDTCIKCQDNCTSCLDFNTTCISCYPGYFLYDDNVTVSCINPCPSHYYATWINSTGKQIIIICQVIVSFVMQIVKIVLGMQQDALTVIQDFTCILQIGNAIFLVLFKIIRTTQLQLAQPVINIAIHVLDHLLFVLFAIQMVVGLVI